MAVGGLSRLLTAALRPGRGHLVGAPLDRPLDRSAKDASEALRLRSGLAVARFHEDMNLLQRDRNAAYFADPEGARLLIASEIVAVTGKTLANEAAIGWPVKSLPRLKVKMF